MGQDSASALLLTPSPCRSHSRRRAVSTAKDLCG